MRAKISQREAHRLLKRVSELESHQRDRLDRWHSGYPGGVNIDQIVLNAKEAAIIDTAMKLDHCIVCKLDSNMNLIVYAVKP